MSTAVPQSEATTVEYVEVTTPRVHNLHHVEILTPEIERSLDFFTRILGLVETGRDGRSVYLKGFGEWGSHSTILTESDRPGLGHMGWQVGEPDQVGTWARRLAASGHEVERVPAAPSAARAMRSASARRPVTRWSSSTSSIAARR